jgi:hypothetical protein
MLAEAAHGILAEPYEGCAGCGSVLKMAWISDAQVGYAITKIPEDFRLHKGVKRVYDQRRQMIESGEGIDWGTAEALAFGTLISEGAPTSFFIPAGFY